MTRLTLGVHRTVVGAVVVLMVGAAAWSVTTLMGNPRAHEHNGGDLSLAAQGFLQATIEAQALTTCLDGARDDLNLDRGARSPSQVADTGAQRRLRTCDTSVLVGALDAVHVPAAGAASTPGQRRARADIVTGTAMLRRVVMDAENAKRAIEHQAQGVPTGNAVALAYRSAQTGSRAAYALADEALALLGHPQSTVG